MRRFDYCIVAPTLLFASTAQAQSAKDILDSGGIEGGLVVHVGCGDGKLTAALRTSDRYLVHGLDTDAQQVAEAREYVRSLGLYGPVSVDTFDGRRLAYVDNLVNLLVAEDLGEVSMDEVMRVLAPLGVAYIGGEKIVNPWPNEIDEWTHFLHGADNNAVAKDTVVGPPKRYQWISGPRWARSHDHLSSLSAMVSAKGRCLQWSETGHHPDWKTQVRCRAIWWEQATHPDHPSDIGESGERRRHSNILSQWMQRPGSYSGRRTTRTRAKSCRRPWLSPAIRCSSRTRKRLLPWMRRTGESFGGRRVR